MEDTWRFGLIKAILFDFGNVLAFFDHHHATRRFAPKSAMPEPEIFRSIYSGPLENSFEAGQLSGPVFLRRVADVIGYRDSMENMHREFVDIFMPNPPVLRLLPALRRRYRLVLASNTNELHSTFFRSTYAEHFQHFHALGMSWQAGIRKPERGFYEYCLRLAGCRASECIFVDDMPANIAGAEAAGIRSILYNNQCDLAAELHKLGVPIEESELRL